MIKLWKSAQTPNSLKSEECRNVLEAIKEKKKNGEKVTSEDYSSLYGKSDVREQLKTDQNDKCAYCEKKLWGDQRPIEHYRPKSQYWHLAFVWDNLFGCCWACNTKKGNGFPLKDNSARFTPKEEPLLINPYIENPEDFIVFHEEVATPKKGLTELQLEKAKTTIEMFLNNEDLVMRRRRWWVAYNTLKDCHELLQTMTGVDNNGFSQEEYTADSSEFAGMIRHQQ